MSNERNNFAWNEHLSEVSRRCLFIGAGVSSGCATPGGHHPPSWDSLLSRLEGMYPSLGAANEEMDPLFRAERIEREAAKVDAGSGALASRIAEEVDFVNGEYVDVSYVHWAIPMSEPELIVTTNYDRILERFFSQKGEFPFNVWSYPGRVDQLRFGSSCSTESSLGDLLRSGEPLIVKLHGTIPDMGPIGEAERREVDDGPAQSPDLVFSYSSYKRAYSAESEIPAFLKAVFSTFQVIFLGYSLRDSTLR